VELNPGVLYKYMLPMKEVPDGKAVIAPPLLVAGNCSIANKLCTIKKSSIIVHKHVLFLFVGANDRGNEIPSPDTHVTVRVPVTRT